MSVIIPVFTAVMQDVNPLLSSSPESLRGFVVVHLLQIVLESTVSNMEHFQAFLGENQNIYYFRGLIRIADGTLNVFYNQQEILLDLMVDMLARYFTRIANLHNCAGNL